MTARAVSGDPLDGQPESSAAGFSAATRGVRTGIDTDAAFGAVVPPIVLSSNFSFTAIDQPRRYDYTRGGNPTRDHLASVLASLEGGAGAVVTATGMAAVTVVLHALVDPGDLVVIPHDCYGGSWRLFDALAAKGHFRVEVLDFADEDAVRDALAGPTAPRLVWLETPSNPLLRITDLRAVADAAHSRGALVAADNTFLSPYFQRPIEHGVDLVVHSSTKYLNGHGDVVAGCVVAATEELTELLASWANNLGLTGSPFDSYLTLRGVRTLHARMRLHEENATAIAWACQGHPAVAAVHYPGLPEHPRHDLAARQQDGFGGMVSVELAGGAAAVRRFVDGLRCFTLAESLGGVESLVAYPVAMSHASMTPQARATAGITDGLIRLSVGIEGTEDLVGDIQGALDRAVTG
ncbi:MAG TPA: cystathionine gamma-synthase [Dermatophilaceae bacterium]|nr:cystathionine gamma-synthase [Dermatophilaceae bacterium]